MKTLYLIRHAKSSWGHSGLRDFDRPLNDRGKHDAPMMGSRLRDRGVSLDLMISSPAKRALKTAGKIAKQLDYDKHDIQQEQTIYEAHPSAIIDVITRVDNKIDSLAVVGHNPGFTMLANYLGNCDIGNMPTCSIVCITCDTDNWNWVKEANGETLFFDFPKNHNQT